MQDDCILWQGLPEDTLATAQSSVQSPQPSHVNVRGTEEPNVTIVADVHHKLCNMACSVNTNILMLYCD